MARLRHAHIEIELPDRWEGRAVSREFDGGELQLLQAANFALPAEVGEYGGGAVELMRPGHIYVAVVEFGPESLGTPLFASYGIPSLAPDDFDPNALQRVLLGQSGVQRFFTETGRPYCLYVVLGNHALRARLVNATNELLQGLALR